jgi:putative DNA primase/helicase
MNVVSELNSLVDNGKPRARDLSKYVVTFSELKDMNIPDREFLVGSWMPKDSFGMVYAERGHGKSWFCMALSVAIAEGAKHFLGWPLAGKQGVLYVDGEMALAEIKERFQSLAKKSMEGLYLLPSETLYRDGVPICLDERSEQNAINALLKSLGEEGLRPQVIVLDNLSTLRRGINENDNSEAQALLDWLISLRHLGHTVIIVHHAGKSGQQRGASIIEVPMDFIIHLKEPDKNKFVIPGEQRFEFRFTKLRGKKPRPDHGTIVLRHDSEHGTEFLCEEEDEFLEKHHIVLRYLKENGHAPQRKISKDLEMSVGSVNEAIQKLRTSGLLQPVKTSNVPNRKGERVLHELWPTRFTLPEGYENVQEAEIPF